MRYDQIALDWLHIQSKRKEELQKIKMKIKKRISYKLNFLEKKRKNKKLTYMLIFLKMLKIKKASIKKYKYILNKIKKKLKKKKMKKK